MTESAQRNWLLTTRLVRAAQGDMQILSPREAWVRLFVQGSAN